MPNGHRRTRCRKQRTYERRRRTRRAAATVRFQQHGGDVTLETWFRNTTPLRKPAEKDMLLSALKDPELTLKPNDPTGPKLETYFPSSLGDIMTNIAVRLGTPLQTGTEFAGVMRGLSEQYPDAYTMLDQLEKDLEVASGNSRIDPSAGVPDLKNEKPTLVPYLWIAYANLVSTEQQQVDPTDVLRPVLIPEKTLTEPAAPT